MNGHPRGAPPGRAVGQNPAYRRLTPFSSWNRRFARAAPDLEIPESDALLPGPSRAQRTSSVRLFRNIQ